MTESQRSDTNDVFVLLPEEHWLFGVKVRNDELHFGSSGVSRAWAILTPLVASFFGAALFFLDDIDTNFFVWDPSQTMLQAIFLAMFALVILNLLNNLRSKVVASAHGVRIRRLLRSEQVPWSAIAGTQIAATTRPSVHTVDFNPGGWYDGNTDTLRAYLVMADRSTRGLPGFAAASKERGAVTPTVTKLGALRRYRETVVGPWPDKRSA